MCGIAGGVGINDPQIDKVKLSISHRGPDSNGSFCEDELFLVHTRLAIQDLSDQANQPMFSEDGRYVIVFNGEIYNHQDIRKRIGTGASFRSTGDTETVLMSYIHFGEHCLNMLNGIFAMAIYDRQKRELFIARDQFGVKPLYIYFDDRDKLMFSSEIKTFLDFDVSTTLSAEALANYLTYLWSPGTLTPFKNVTKLLPGHYLRIDVGKKISVNPVKYYQLDFNGIYSDQSEDELVDELEKKLLKAVERQMLSDVPVGFFLSGGLDSSLLVAMARKLYPSMILPCFTIDTSDLSRNEGFADDLHYAKIVAKHLNVNLHVVKAEIDIVQDFDKMIWHLDEPQADAAPLNVFNISSFARNCGIKVLIGGAAGDDLFSGYRRHQALKYETYFKCIPLFIGKLIKGFANILSVDKTLFRRIRKITQYLDKNSEERLAGYFSWLDEDVMKSLFTEQFQQQLSGYSPLSFLIALNKDIPKESSLLNKMLYWEMKSFLVDHNLNYTDKLSMAVGVEARVPYLDKELVEFAIKIPPSLKLRDNETKYILKKVAERYLPKDLIYRPKTGFGAPVRKWITEDLKKTIEEKLSEIQIRKRGLFNYNAVQKLIKDNQAGKIDASYIIWGLLAIESWMTQFVDASE
ncbi:MAG: asparagine synthase (glutamine-hydrolyzing) [Microcystis aeruginosa Ma_AC_P_19900807_S300]|nr:MAG: asparagine synthase (glutamine-hydrolyzing) [Microcystis aeruginosa Ma_AC_P_19900807_S300]